VRIDFAALGKKRGPVMEALRARQIGTQVHYLPLHLQPDFAYLGYKNGAFPVSESIYEQALSLPMYPAMTDDDVRRVASTLREMLGV
jgi:dTDP-4-amino-4,6-dideoxygalactose transaminase